MDAFVKPSARDPNSEHDDNRPDRSEVEAALRTIIRWTGDDPDRARPDRDAGPHGARVRGVFLPATLRIPPRSCRRPSRRSKATTK